MTISRRSLFQSAAGLLGAVVVTKPDETLSENPASAPAVILIDPACAVGPMTAIVRGPVTTSSSCLTVMSVSMLNHGGPGYDHPPVVSFADPPKARFEMITQGRSKVRV